MTCLTHNWQRNSEITQNPLKSRWHFSWTFSRVNLTSCPKFFASNLVWFFFFVLPSHDFIGDFTTSYRELARGQSQFNVYEVSHSDVLTVQLHVCWLLKSLGGWYIDPTSYAVDISVFDISVALLSTYLIFSSTWIFSTSAAEWVHLLSCHKKKNIKSYSILCLACSTLHV